MSRARGNALPHAKLTPELVREIRENRHGMTDRQFAAKYGINRNTVYRCRHGYTWGHI